MKNVGLFTLALALAFVVGCQGEARSPLSPPVPAGNAPGRPEAQKALSLDKRTALVMEHYRALSSTYCTGPSYCYRGTSTKAIGGNAVSDWNYITDPWDRLGGYYWIKARYTGVNLSVLPNVGNPTSYGYQNGYGRGFQCRAYTNYVLYRSGTYPYTLPAYATCFSNYAGSRSYTRSIETVRVGDVIQCSGHTATVVRIMAGVEGSSVSSVDVIDSNFVGGRGNEMIGRHVISKTYQGGTGDLATYIVVDVYSPNIPRNS